MKGNNKRNKFLFGGKKIIIIYINIADMENCGKENLNNMTEICSNL